MRLRSVFILIAALSLLLSGAVSGFAEGETAEPLQGGEETAGFSAGSGLQWLWGEVVSLDFQKSEFVIRYLDYDTDMENETVVNATDKTTYENVKSIYEIKPRDTLSIDYAVDNEGRKVAVNIGVEKPEPGETQSQGITPPELEQ